MTLQTLGWSERWQREFERHAEQGLVPGRVIGEHRTHYRVAADQTEVSAEITGRFRSEAGLRSDLPGVGDFVALRLAGADGRAIIEAVLPRTTALVRVASGEQRPQLLAANVDVIFIVTSLDGDLNLPRLQRYLDLVRSSGAEPVIVVNKIDLAENIGAVIEGIGAIAPGVVVHAIAARGALGSTGLERYFEGNRTVAVIGSSGVGKSTLTNCLLGRDAQATGEVRAHDNRGRHTTTQRQLFIRPGGGAIVDTPGMRGLELWDAGASLAEDFGDIESLAARCRFRDCRHKSEPSCAVRAAIDDGTLDAGRLAKYAVRPSSQSRGRH